jgi:hypothetical protein
MDGNQEVVGYDGPALVVRKLENVGVEKDDSDNNDGDCSVVVVVAMDVRC